MVMGPVAAQDPPGNTKQSVQQKCNTKPFRFAVCRSVLELRPPALDAPRARALPASTTGGHRLRTRSQLAEVDHQRTLGKQNKRRAPPMSTLNVFGCARTAGASPAVVLGRRRGGGGVLRGRRALPRRRGAAPAAGRGAPAAHRHLRPGHRPARARSGTSSIPSSRNVVVMSATDRTGGRGDQTAAGQPPAGTGSRVPGPARAADRVAVAADQRFGRRAQGAQEKVQGGKETAHSGLQLGITRHPLRWIRSSR